MPTETKPLPALAVTAFAQLQNAANVEHTNICRQTLEAMGLSADDGWKIDVANRQVIRTTPDAPPEG